MIEAGSETTSQALNNCIIGLLSNPEAVRKAHEELDRVVGNTRTPTFADEKNLPWVRAIVQVSAPFCGKVLTEQELLRWRPVNKFGMNHYNTEDDWYNGYFIPKGSVVMINWWAFHYDPEYYPEPEKVIPFSITGNND
jgi:cytochrome P450